MYFFILSISFLSLLLNINLQGISMPPCFRSEEYLRFPVTSHLMLPPRLKNKEDILDIFLGK
jgi:hypothetical protein